MSATSTLNKTIIGLDAYPNTAFETLSVSSDFLKFHYKRQQIIFKIQQKIKRVFDLVAAVLGITVISPVLVLIAVLVKLSSKGPVFYLSQRIGQNQLPFYMFKFRTMVTDAEKQRQKLAMEIGCDDKLFKMEHDPRVTPLGDFLRKSSLDELPQLFNVLMGQMSLVGPRPYVPEESRLFEQPYTARFEVLPGMTGPWQVSGRSNLEFKQLCEMEFDYLSQWSLLTDLSILLRTIPAVFTAKGAF